MRGQGNESIRSHETRGQLARLSHRQSWDQSLAAKWQSLDQSLAAKWQSWDQSLAGKWHLDERCWWQAHLLDADLDQEGDWTARSTLSLNSLISP